MASPTMDAVCAALAARVATVSGISRAKGYADDQINPPEAQVFSRPFDPRVVYGSAQVTYQLGVRVFVSRTDMRTAQKTLRGFMETNGTGSVLAKIEDESSWTVTIHSAEVTEIGQPFEVEIQNAAGGVTTYWAVDFDVEVFA